MKTLIAALLFTLSLYAQTGSPLIVADVNGVPGTQVNQSIAIVNGKMYFSGPFASGTTYSQGNVVISGPLAYVSLTNNNLGNTPGVSGAWQQLGPGVLIPATATVLGGVIVPASGGLAIDGSGNLSMTQSGILSKIGAAGIPNSYLLTPYITINGQQVNLGANFTTPAIPIATVFGRVGAIVGSTGDYSASQVTNAVDQTQTYSNPGWLSALAWGKLTGVPSLVNSFNGRSGAIVPATADYTAAQVTNALDSTQSYSNPGWLTALPWTKITGAPTFITGNQVITISGDATGSGTTAITLNVSKLNGTSLASLASGVLYNTTGTGVPSIASSSQLLAAIGAIPNASLTNPGMTINGTFVPLGGSVTVTGGGGGTYSLPIASSSVLGGVKIGSGLSVDGSGVLSATGAAGTWGSITGTLSSQSDLNAALTLKQNASAPNTNNELPLTFSNQFTRSGNAVSLASGSLVTIPSTGTGVLGIATSGGNPVFLTSPTLLTSLFTGCSGAMLLGFDGACHAATAGLADSGANGILKRTALNTTAPAVAGTDYQAPLVAGTDYATPAAVAAVAQTTNQKTRTLGASFSGGGSALIGSQTVCTPFNFSGTIQQATLIGDVSGSATVDVRYISYASYTGPASAATVTASATPALSSAVKYQDATLTGWTTAITPGIACFVLSSPSTVTSLSLSLKVLAN